MLYLEEEEEEEEEEDAKKGCCFVRVCFCLLTESKSFLASSKIQHRAKVESD